MHLQRLGQQISGAIQIANDVALYIYSKILKAILRCFDDPHKCRDLVPGRVLSSRYKWSTTVKLSCQVEREPSRLLKNLLRKVCKGPDPCKTAYVKGRQYSCKTVTSDVTGARLYREGRLLANGQNG
uniref:Uncharacterized protein n=1 Tax=Solanum tuberosum TaxID=4113 RepID=M1AM31_SOLTU